VSVLHSANYDHWHRADDLELVIAARGWSQYVRFGNFEDYKRRFEEKVLGAAVQGGWEIWE